MDMTLKGQWKQLQGKVKQKWGDLTDDDIKKTEGDFDRLVGVIQERYGYAAAQAKQQVAEFVQLVTSSSDDQSNRGDQPDAHREPTQSSSAHRVSS